MTQKKHGWRGLALRLGVSVAALFFIVHTFEGKLHEAIGILKNEVRWEYFLLAAVTYLGGLTLLAIRLEWVFRVHKIVVNFFESFYLGLVGLFFNLFLPSAVGGDVVKAYYAYKHSGKKVESMTSVIMDRLLGFAALSIMAMAAVLLYSKQLQDERIARMVYFFIGGMAVLALFFASRRFARIFSFFAKVIPAGLKEKLSTVYHAIYEFKFYKKLMVGAICLSLVGQCLFIIVHYWLALSLQADISLFIFFVLIPILSVVSMAPSLGGLGVRELAVMHLFGKYMGDERAFALSLLLDILIYGFSIISGVIFMIRGGLKSKVLHEMETLE
jgi:glycosyltransferase 2 family protein